MPPRKRSRAAAVEMQVTTVAGSPSESGHRDGAATQALFGGNTGTLGITMDLDGNIIVADGDNHCIRRIAADGTVSTLAGSPDREGHTDGSLDRAQFNFPTDVAVDHEGNHEGSGS